MPQVYKFDLKRMSPNVKISGEKHSKSKVYYNEYAEKYGRGFGGVGELIKSGVQLVKDNKDLIVESGKAASSIASAVSKVNDAIKSDKDLQLIKEIREKADKNKKVTSKTKDKIANIYKGDSIAKF